MRQSNVIKIVIGTAQLVVLILIWLKQCCGGNTMEPIVTKQLPVSIAEPAGILIFLAALFILMMIKIYRSK